VSGFWRVRKPEEAGAAADDPAVWPAAGGVDVWAMAVDASRVEHSSPAVISMVFIGDIPPIVFRMEV
jgi:hypothetical protein